MGIPIFWQPASNSKTVDATVFGTLCLARLRDILYKAPLERPHRRAYRTPESSQTLGFSTLTPIRLPKPNTSGYKTLRPKTIKATHVGPYLATPFCHLEPRGVAMAPCARAAQSLSRGKSRTAACHPWDGRRVRRSEHCLVSLRSSAELGQLGTWWTQHPKPKRTSTFSHAHRQLLQTYQLDRLQ